MNAIVDPTNAGSSGNTCGRNRSREPVSSRYASEITLGLSRARTWLLLTALGLGSWIYPYAAEAEPQSLVSDDRVGDHTDPDYDALLDEALTAFDAHDYARARGLFERAHALRPNARVLRGLGIADLHLKRFTLAKRELTAALEDDRQPLTVAQRNGVMELLTWMQTDLGSVRLQLTPANAHVEVDDEPLVATELILEPGSHRLRVSSPGFDARDYPLQIAAGESRTLEVTLTPREPEATPAISARAVASASPRAASPASSPRPLVQPRQNARDDDSSSVLERWWFWTAVGVVVAGGVATTVALTSPAPTQPFEKGGLGGVMMPLGRAP